MQVHLPEIVTSKRCLCGGDRWLERFVEERADRKATRGFAGDERGLGTLTCANALGIGQSWLYSTFRLSPLTSLSMASARC